MLANAGAVQQQALAFGGFQGLVAASTPVAWWDFQSSWTSQLTDVSGNGRHLARIGSSEPPTAAPFRSTASQSCNFSTYDSRSNYFEEVTNEIETYFANQPAVTCTITIKKDLPTATWQKWIGISASDTVNVFSLHAGPFSSGVNLEHRFSEGTTATSYYLASAANDVNAHIITMRYQSGSMRLFVDGAIAGTSSGGADTVLRNLTTEKFQIGGTFASAAAGTFRTDHVHINDYGMSDAAIIAMHNQYIAELLPDFVSHVWDSPGTGVGLSERLGFRFTVSEDIEINQLSCFVGSTLNELVYIHRVSDGAVICNAGCQGTAGTWVDTNITPVTLSSTEEYTCSARASGSSRIVYRNPSNLVTDPRVTFTANVFGSSEAIPTSTTGNVYAFPRFGYVTA